MKSSIEGAIERHCNRRLFFQFVPGPHPQPQSTNPMEYCSDANTKICISPQEKYNTKGLATKIGLKTHPSFTSNTDSYE